MLNRFREGSCFLSRCRLLRFPMELGCASALMGFMGRDAQTLRSAQSALSPVKITDIETWVLTCGSLFVLVRTNQGITGYGESSPMNTRAIASMVTDALKPLVLGQNALDRDRLWERMYFTTYKLGVMGAQPEA